MRELAVLRSTGSGIEVIFEGLVERQVVETGPIGTPSSAMSMTDNQMHRVVTILVKRVYKGKAQGEVTVTTGMGMGDCGYDFYTGKEYLVYANAQRGMLFTSICTGTDLLAESGPALRFLRGEPPAADDLLDPQTYYAKYVPQWTGKVCGQVTKADGSPFGGAEVELTERRGDGLPPVTFSDQNLAKPDGSFCVTGIDPGNYLLTAEGIDFNRSIRWAGYYFNATGVSQASSIQVHEGDNLTNFRFMVQQQSLYTVTFRVAKIDKTVLPWEHLGVFIKGSDVDPLAYHKAQDFEKDDSCVLDLIPPGHYSVVTFAQPDPATGVPPEILKWQMANKEIEITGDTEIVLTLRPAVHPVP